MVKLKNSLDVPVKVVKTNVYDLGDVQPGDTVDVTLDAETVQVELIKPT